MHDENYVELLEQRCEELEANLDLARGNDDECKDVLRRYKKLVDWVMDEFEFDEGAEHREEVGGYISAFRRVLINKKEVWVDSIEHRAEEMVRHLQPKVNNEF